MTVLRSVKWFYEKRAVGGRGLWQPVLLVGVLTCVLLWAASSGLALAPAQAADASADDASASPSDVKLPAPDQEGPDREASESSDVGESAADAAKKSCCWPCEEVCCRRVRLLGRLLRRLRQRRGCCCCCEAAGEPAAAAEKITVKTTEPPKPDPYAWKDLFDGKTLEGWKAPNFGGEGKVYVEDGKIVMEMGEMMTGATYTGEVPRDNYELEYEGIRLEGVDFFATVTFPVAKSEASFVTGGWGGTVVGISCIDYYDASDNLTTTFHDFKDKRWYKFRVRVTPAKIEAWIGDEQVVNQERKGRKFDIRDECDLCRPLGFATFTTTGAVRNIRLRKLKPATAAEEPAKEE